MLSNVSWAMYAGIIGTIVFIYYLIIYLRFKPKSIHHLFFGQSSNETKSASWKLPAIEASDSNRFSLTPQKEDNFYEEEEDDTHQAFDKMFVEVKQIIAAASKGQLDKLQLLQQLGQVIKNYPGLKSAGVHDSMTELIVSETEKYETVALSENEVEHLWHG